jgi:hypothetical protein
MEVNLTKRIDTPEGRRYYPARLKAGSAWRVEVLNDACSSYGVHQLCDTIGVLADGTAPAKMRPTFVASLEMLIPGPRESNSTCTTTYRNREQPYRQYPDTPVRHSMIGILLYPTKRKM